MLIVSALEIQELQNPYKNASPNPYIVESKECLPGMDSNHESALDGGFPRPKKQFYLAARAPADFRGSTTPERAACAAFKSHRQSTHRMATV
jgi:hypothetical protein